MSILRQDHELLEQFLCPHTGQILEASKTGMQGIVCIWPGHTLHKWSFKLHDFLNAVLYI